MGRAESPELASRRCLEAKWIEWPDCRFRSSEATDLQPWFVYRSVGLHENRCLLSVFGHLDSYLDRGYVERKNRDYMEIALLEWIENERENYGNDDSTDIQVINWNIEFGDRSQRTITVARSSVDKHEDTQQSIQHRSELHDPVEKPLAYTGDDEFASLANHLFTITDSNLLKD